jgi:protein LTV1
MPRRKFIDKKNATTFSLVYRAQNDPKIHDPEASDMVFTEKLNPNREKVKKREDLEDEFGEIVRDNEGEAAQYGVYFDDSEYDYMQHLREMGTSSEAHFMEAPVTIKMEGKGKEKMRLEDALRNMDIRSEADTRSVASSRVSSIAEELLPSEMLPSEFFQTSSYQNQQNIPDEIAGFQPDMDPRLREVLQALDNEAYIDNDEDVFEQLAQDGEEIAKPDWEVSWHNTSTEDDEGWESDRTVTAGKETSTIKDDDTQQILRLVTEANPNEDWMSEFQKFKKNATLKTRMNHQSLPQDTQPSVQTGASSITELRRKKRKGALTASTGYSMTSSILARTERQSILDQKFEKLQEVYADDEMNDDESMLSGFSGFSRLSSVSKEPTATVTRSDFDSIMDDFLGRYSEVGQKSRRVKRNKPQSGLEQLKEIREGLGPPLIRKEKV